MPKLACAIGLLTAYCSTHAHTFCITNAAQLQDALTQSSAGGLYDAEDNTLHLVHGLYQTGAATGNAPFFYTSPNSMHFFGIAGGYADGCNAPTRQTPRTRLDGGGHTGVLALRSAQGAVDVRGLTLQNGDGAQPGTGLQVNYLVSANAAVAIQDVVVRNNHSSGNAGGVFVTAGGGTLWFVNNQITGNSADGNYGGGLITGNGTDSEVYNNTVARNTTVAVSGAVGGLYCGGTASCNVHGGIFWNNTGAGLYLGGDGTLRYNDYGVLGGQAPGTSEGNVSVNPQFVDADNGDFHLAGNSPLLGTSPYYSYAIDLDGNPPTESGRIDLGAYEETIFVDGVDED
ncbi:MAG: right-handed parallel beta-helix repeat-containing protein [Dokdonella sp.]